MVDINLEIENKSSIIPLPEAISPQNEGKRVKRKEILNLLNFVNFREGTIFANFRQLKYDQTLSLQAFPLPCKDQTLECRWMQPGIKKQHLENYAFDSFLLSNGHDLFRVKAEVTHLDENGIVFRIPDFGHEKSLRKIKRHECESIDVSILQNGVVLSGRLADFNAVSCRIGLTGDSVRSMVWINPDVPVVLNLEKNGRSLFSGNCLITRSDIADACSTIVLAPNFNNLRRFTARGVRNQRHALAPAPNVSFSHPLTGKRVYLQATDISSSGFATEEFLHNSMLLPGLIIPELSVSIGNHFVLECLAQVLYRNVIQRDSGEALVQCGVVFLDMSIENQASLSALLHQNADKRMRVCNQVDMEELWRFFFESGFIYPSKYLSIQAYKEEFKKTYEKLYLKSPAIARHFIFQDRGVLFGHMSMIRSNAKTWMIHHHAAARSGYGLAGVAVLDHIGQYILGFYLHPSTHMNYIMCYYRDENHFPSRVFGGVVRDMANPKASSVDTFAYTHLADLEPLIADRPARPASSQVLPAGREDLLELTQAYEQESGGLSLEALNLSPDLFSENLLNEEYRRHGFVRDRQVFALKHEGVLSAIITISISDLGLNLSNLTNCFHVFVVDQENLSAAELAAALRGLASHFAGEEMPVLVYPSGFLNARSIPHEKEYNLWVVNMRFSDIYFRSIDTTFKRDLHGRNDSKRAGD